MEEIETALARLEALAEELVGTATALAARRARAERLGLDGRLARVRERLAVVLDELRGWAGEDDVTDE